MANLCVVVSGWSIAYLAIGIGEHTTRTIARLLGQTDDSNCCWTEGHYRGLLLLGLGHHLQQHDPTDRPNKLEEQFAITEFTHFLRQTKCGRFRN